MNKFCLFCQKKKKAITMVDAESSEQHPEDISADIFMDDAAMLDTPTQAEITAQPSGGGPKLTLIDSHGVLTRRRGKATCQDIRDLPLGTRAMIEINAAGQPCNVPASTLLTSYLGVLVRDSTMAPISFTDWRSPGLELYKRRLMEEVEVKFSYPPQLQIWIRQALGNKWRAYKTSLKAKYWDPKKAIEEIIARVPDGVDAVQWATLVAHWNVPREKKISDRLLLWKISRLRKDGSWVSEEAKQKWELACDMLAAKQLTPEDGNTEENESVFRDVIGPEHPGRVRCKGFGVTPSKYYPEASTSSTASSYMSASHAERFNNLETEIATMKKTMT